VKKLGILLALSGLLVLFAACGKSSSGGGDSETNWMKQCQTQSDCGPGTSCFCGMCSKACAATSDCSGLGARANCASPGDVPGCAASAQPAGVCVASCSSSLDCSAGFECSTSGCTPLTGTGGAPGAGGTPETGTGGTPETGQGGSNCLSLPRGPGGASSVLATSPGTGTPCPPSLEGFELCTPKGSLQTSEKALSRCRNGTWRTIEDPSECVRPVGPGCEEPGVCLHDVLECNHPEARDGVCCSLPRYCENLHGVCDGERWWMTALDASSSCGDGVRQQDEECDDGNFESRDDCLVTCSRPRCGDGVVHDQGTGNEACDEGSDNGPFPAACNDECQPALCGNGEIDDGEACDDGDLIPGDGCDDQCRVEE